MSRTWHVVCVLLAVLAIPSAVAAEFRRVEIKTLGMD